MSFKSSTDAIFDRGDRVAPLGLIVMNGAEELGKEINQYLVQWSRQGGGDEETFLIEAECPRFATGDGKGLIKSTVRGSDLFILTDVGNYNCSYKLFGYENHMSPDDHYQDLKRLIQAAEGKAHRINVIMPLLYGGRQHRRNYRESLDCAVMLQEMRHMGVSNLVTFDAHDPRVQNAVPLMGLDNMMPTYQVLKCLLHHYPDLQFDKDHFMIVSPDEGAMNRNMYYSSVLSVNLGMFYKRRDYSRIVNGGNPIVAHEYLGDSVEGKDIFIADDILSSGESVLDIVYELKKRKANRIFAAATFALFTHGLKAFDKAYEEGIIAGVFGTNLTYLMPELRSRSWFHEVDMAKYIAYYVASLNHDMSVGLILDPHKKIDKLLQNRDIQQG
ncbi:MAG: ribose-phosphate pyrophosphokinase [Oscillospiraceae bacterium]|jgi:ribose-phosphate pyrophosphokinase|nr:ribose-phosphate pyrophosphokinase [Oscillospiraceae bacterium]